MTAPSRKALVLTAAAALVAVAIGVSTTGTLAYFTDQASVSAGSSANTAFTSGSVATPATPTVTQTATTGLAAVSWIATTVTTGAGNTTATSYDVLRYTAATGGTATVVCSAVTATSCSAPKVAGASYYAVRARFQANWVNEGGRRAHTPDTTGPTVVISTNVGACTNGVACGTASDSGGGTVAKVEYNLLRRVSRTGFPTSYDCWNGTAWIDVASASCTWSNAIGTTSWRVPGNQGTAYAGPPNGWTYTLTLTVRGTDSFGNVGPTDVETANI